MRPQAPSRTSSRASRASLSLDLSNIPAFQPPTPPSNTLLFTNLQDLAIFRPDNLQTIRELISKTAPIHTWAPLKSFRRILVTFFTETDAIAVRSVWDGEAIMGDRARVYFGQPTPVHATPKDVHLALPDAGKLFFISPPPSPPHDWEQRLEGAPNKEVHAEDLADALARLHHGSGNPAGDALMVDSPISPVEGKSPGGMSGSGSGRANRSRSSTLIFGGSPSLPCVMVDDLTEDVDGEEDAGVSPMDIEPKPIMAHTSRPPVELMNHA